MDGGTGGGGYIRGVDGLGLAKDREDEVEREIEARAERAFAGGSERFDAERSGFAERGEDFLGVAEHGGVSHERDDAERVGGEGGGPGGLAKKDGRSGERLECGDAQAAAMGLGERGGVVGGEAEGTGVGDEDEIGVSGGESGTEVWEGWSVEFGGEALCARGGTDADELKLGKVGDLANEMGLVWSEPRHDATRGRHGGMVSEGRDEGTWGRRDEADKATKRRREEKAKERSKGLE